MKDMVKNCINIVKDTSMKPEDRARFLILSSNEVGFDLTVPLTQIIERLDRVAELEKLAAKLKAKVAEEEAKKVQPLQPEIFMRRLDGKNGPSALVLCQSGPMVCPIEGELEAVERGDYVLLDRSSGKIVCRDGAIVPTGEIARIEKVPAVPDGLAVLSVRDQRYTAHLSEAAWKSGDLKPGAEAVFDPLRHFVHAILPAEIDGADILTPASELSGFSLDGLGSPNPVIWRILRIVKCGVVHPEWEQRMRARQRRSFLFWGPTGGGKTATIKVIVNLVADWVEDLTGVREPLVCFCDASTFYAPYLGEAEARIVTWFKKLSAVAGRELVAKDGRRVRVPLICVFEEIEHLVRQRGEPGGSSHLFDRLLALILQKMDSALKELELPIIFIATTNRKDLLDAAARRRFAERECRFTTLTAGAALAVLEKKVADEMEIQAATGEDQATARLGVIRAALHYLYGSGDEQAIAEATMRDSSRRQVCRRHLVTGALLETAVSRAVDESLDHSVEIGDLVGISAGSLVQALSEQFDAIATSLTAQNVVDYAPDLFDDPLQIASVRPLRRFGRRPAAQFTS